MLSVLLFECSHIGRCWKWCGTCRVDLPGSEGNYHTVVNVCTPSRAEGDFLVWQEEKGRKVKQPVLVGICLIQGVEGRVGDSSLLRAVTIATQQPSDLAKLIQASAQSMHGCRNIFVKSLLVLCAYLVHARVGVHTHTRTDLWLYAYVHVCVCVCVNV